MNLAMYYHKINAPHLPSCESHIFLTWKTIGVMILRNVLPGLREACSRGDVTAARHMIKELGVEAEMIINSAPNGSNTLLFK